MQIGSLIRLITNSFNIIKLYLLKAKLVKQINLKISLFMNQILIIEEYLLEYL